MSFAYAIANGLMRAAALAAPRDRADWTQAMGAEFAAVEGGGAALGWAAGCLAAALGWRLRAEAFYLLGLAAAPIVPLPALMVLFVAARPYGLPTAALGWLVPAVVFALPCLLLAAWRPARAWLAVLAVLAPRLLDMWTGFLAPLLAAPFDHYGETSSLPNWALALQFAGVIAAAPLMGAGLGWALGRMLRKGSARA